MPSDSSVPAAHGLALLVALLTLASMLGTSATGLLPTIAPAAAQAYGIPAKAIGYQFGVVALAMLISLATLSSLPRRWGSARVIQAGLLLTALSLAIALVPNLALLGVASLGMGLGYGLLMPAISHLMLRHTPAEKLNLYFSIQQTGIPLGSILAAAVGPALTVAFGWRWALGANIVALLALVCALQPSRARWDADRDPRATAWRNPLAGLRLVWAHPVILRISLAGTCFSAAQFCVTTYTVVALVEGMGYGLIEAGLVLTCAQAAGTGSRVACGWIADRWQAAVPVLTGLGVAIFAAFALTFLLSPDWPRWAVVLLFAAHGLATLGWPGVGLAEIGRLAPAGQISLVTGGSLVCTNLGKTLGPLAFASLYTLSGSASFTFGVMSLLGVGAASVLLGARRGARA